MDTCSQCDRAAKYFRRIGTTLSFTCDLPQHLRAQGGDTNDWRSLGAMGGGLLKTARVGASTIKAVHRP
jgi:hypothetical protein